MLSNLVRLAVAAALIIPAGSSLTLPDIPVFALYTALILVVVFVSSLFRSDRKGA